MAAYAVTNHIAITGSIHNRNEVNFYKAYRVSPFDTSFVYYKRREWEAGLGYFMTLNKSKTVMINFYSGIGNGTYKVTDTGFVNSVRYQRIHTSAPFKFYFQPSLNFVFPSARIGAICRVNVIKFNNVITNYTSDELVSFHLDGLNNKVLVFPEIGINFVIRLPQWPWVAVEGQTSVNFNDDAYYRSRTFNASAGLLIEPFELLKKKKITE
ncbi:MAG: hypothetical protein HYX40_10905 [Sphingobacteriales bacterium]|nr:hypothetical protein [Sphingobacteriales bacterium]